VGRFDSVEEAQIAVDEVWASRWRMTVHINQAAQYPAPTRAGTDLRGW
jgi:hypothetical protein